MTLAIREWPSWLFGAGAILLAALVVVFAALGLRRLQRRWADGDLGVAAAFPSVAFLALPLYAAVCWMDTPWLAWAMVAALAAWAGYLVVRGRGGQDLPCRMGEGFGMAAMGSLGLMVLEFVLLGFAVTVGRLPAMAGAPGGLEAPGWLANVHWAKPAIMIMGFWIGIGSNNMLLYLAGLSNVPPELYEAADIDGAKRGQRFWNITWPQLAPTTFFIVIMSVIGGLQGGFEMARVMTNGGPAGATTTLSFFVYQEGFRTGRLGFSAAVAWALFAMILVATLFNWRFGNRYVND
jgi:multiple sugar transport system permease protein